MKFNYQVPHKKRWCIRYFMLYEIGNLYIASIQAQLRDLQQVAEDLQIRLEGHRRRAHEADSLREQTLKALQAGDNGKCYATSNTL